MHSCYLVQSVLPTGIFSFGVLDGRQQSISYAEYLRVLIHNLTFSQSLGWVPLWEDRPNRHSDPWRKTNACFSHQELGE